MTNPIIAFRNVSKVFEDSGTQVLKDINFELEEGKFYTLLGASGSGKSTILNIIAGLLDATSGDVLLDGKRINDIPINKRDVHTVFQSYALFPHMNVFDNVAFALKLKKVPKKEIEERVEEALKMVQLNGYQKRSIQKLSGGQRQRVAIARAIINQPRVVLLDEPLSALDLKLRTEMQYELRELQQRLGITFVFVTHDQEEALAIVMPHFRSGILRVFQQIILKAFEFGRYIVMEDSRNQSGYRINHDHRRKFSPGQDIIPYGYIIGHDLLQHTFVNPFIMSA